MWGCLDSYALAKKWDLLHKGFMLEMSRFHSGSKIKTYRQFMIQDGDRELLKIYMPAMLGGKSFISIMKKRFFRKKFDQQVPDSRTLVPEISHIIDKVCNIYDVNPDDLAKIRLGAPNEPRDVAIYLIRTLRAEPLTQIAPLFNYEPL